VRRQFLSLAGTLRNCSGGATPWGSWLSCEESVIRRGEFGAARDHGFVFEVPSTARELLPARPLEAMGRFHREAVAVDPHTGIVYQTEDRFDGLLYRFVPEVPGSLARGGRLEALAIRGLEGVSTANLVHATVPLRSRLAVHWIALDRVDAPDDDLRRRGRAAGASSFVRGEGMAVDLSRGEVRVWFVCTMGGPRRLGQLWCYRPSPVEGTAHEGRDPGTLELFLESDQRALVNQGDNLVPSPLGDVLVCEDNPHVQHVVGVTPDGGVYPVARNPRRDSEFAGATFASGGTVLYLNLQLPGLTLAVTGPWRERSA
jgi:secreted PhoX family phosphatase